MLVKFNCRGKLNVMKCISVVKGLWLFVVFCRTAFCCNRNGYNTILYRNGYNTVMVIIPS